MLLEVDGGLALLAAPLRKLYHWRNKNTRQGSRGNIKAHYDLGNDLYALFLDETMTYSCGIFERPGSTLAEASIAKYDRLCRKLALKETDHLLEIGTGWGGFALHAATRYGCRVTTTTISRAQYRLGRTAYPGKGLEERIRLLLTDYRDLSGTYQKMQQDELNGATSSNKATYCWSCSTCTAVPSGSTARTSSTRRRCRPGPASSC